MKPTDTGVALGVVSSNGPTGWVPFEEVEARPPEFSDESLALRLAGDHADDLRFVDAWGRWLIWVGKRWAFDETRKAFDLARKICRQASAQCYSKAAKQIASARTVAGIHRLAQADQRLAATTGQWDSDPWALNTPDCIIDLRSAERRPATPSDYSTKITAVAPGGQCPLFHRFLDEVMGHDAEMTAFLQRMFGYALTGSTQEHALFFLYGTGANGKSVLLNTVSGIVGDYHKAAPIETFTASNIDRHPTELAMLRGARLVTSVETEEGRRWAESRIKALTGGDKISARFMRQDFFEFTPTFKLIVAGNHKPGLRTVDEAIRRRFNLVPFTVTIPPNDRDPELEEKLKREWPGILQWMIDGALEWNERGLDPPETVRRATDAYLESEDALSAWIDESCERDPGAWEKTASLFCSWKAWADRSGEYPGSLKRFTQNLETRGFTYERKMDGRGFRGLKINLVQVEPHWSD